ncbi:NUDIX domain-containing protein [Streptomyces sp. TRM 70351]|uniref:NUDIX domain-containing protein n=1 Tax=Streptomyces sp. TRM 70351 TaxID=3116552 RepID=UPI002E7C5350|nr:NUDIX domain-containing protein [Streptomyces sp. TRM 70351]MEE1931529.1 NUDIX domain-containing protein [Streptomyces sp. TRM 70351]
MPPSSSSIRKAVETYLVRHPGERDALAGLLAALDRPVDVTARTTLPGHVTCSAVVIDRQCRLLHIRHRTTGLLLPGGHIEPEDRALLAAALREVAEEAGISPGNLCLTRQMLGSPIDIDVHDIDANPAKGEPAHRHYDFRHVFYIAGDEPSAITLQNEEVSGARWLPMAEVTSPTLREKLLQARLDGQPEPVNACALIHDGRGRYLLHLRDHKPGIWQPGAFALLGGGRTHDDPSLEGTLLRELSEEVPDLLPEDLEPYAVETATSVDGLSVPIQVFTGIWRGDPDRLRLHEGVLLRWFTPDVLDRLRLSPATRDLIRRHAAENPPGGASGAATPLQEGGRRPVLNGIGVHLHLEDDEGRVLLGLRHPDAGFAGNTWHYLAGKCEQESAVACLVREAREEAGLVIDPADVDLAHIVHVVDAPGGPPLMQLVFRARRWKGEPKVLETDKCLGWKWWPPHELPDRLVSYTRTALVGIAEGRAYSELGW